MGDLSPHIAKQIAPMVAALRANGVEPTSLILHAGIPGHRRRARQAKARAHKLFEAMERRGA